MKSFSSKLGRIGTGISKILISRVAIPWYEQQTGDVVAREVGTSAFAIRNEVARKTHEGLARSVWRLRGEDLPGSIDFLVEDVEAETLEDGEYLLKVSLQPRNMDVEDENYDPKDIKPMPLHLFLENFVPVGTISMDDYDA